MYDVAFVVFYCFVFSVSACMFIQPFFVWAVFFILVWSERRIFGRLNAIVTASKTIKARASSYLISYME